MKRHVLAAVVAIIGAATLTVSAVAAVAPGTYKGSLHLASGAKIPASPATVTVAGNKVTIKAPKFPDQVPWRPPASSRPALGPDEVRVQGDDQGRKKVSGNYIAPLAGNGEYFSAKGTFSRATKSFAGTLSVVQQMCRGSATIKAKKA